MTTIVVLGASGFAGGELLRILDAHVEVKVVAAAASSRAGTPVWQLYPWTDSEMKFCTADEALEVGADFVFSSLPHTESMKLLGPYTRGKVIDLGGDFRIKDPSVFKITHSMDHLHPDSLAGWAYGLTELHREEIRNSDRVANPGCYAAAALLVLAPLIQSRQVMADGIHIDGKSGVSGAGRAGGEGFDFSAANENLRPYKVTGHAHIAEIEQELALAAGSDVSVSFVPHLVPMSRGILTTCVARAASGATDETLSEALSESYAGEPFVRVLESGLPETRRLSGTNVAEVKAVLDERTGTVIAMAALDNLGKGAAGQAVQNMNLMLGIDETTGLTTAGLIP